MSMNSKVCTCTVTPKLTAVRVADVELFCKEEMQISFPIMMTAGGILVIQGVPIAVTINDLPNEVPDDMVTLK